MLSGPLITTLVHLSLVTLFFSPLEAKPLKSGVVIILNGPSASGKSSLQKALQELFEEPYLAIGIDTLFNAVIPDQYGSRVVLKSDSALYRSVRNSKDLEGKSVVELLVGPEGEKVIRGMHGSIAAYAKAGNNVIVDYILYKKDWLLDLQAKLKGLRVYYVGIKLPLEELEKREAKRGTSPPGHARSHYNSVHGAMAYDITIDTSEITPKETAKLIRNYIIKK